MMLQGKIHDVLVEVTGAELDQASAIGDTVLYLSSIDDFSEDGGQISIDGDSAVNYLTVAETEVTTTDAEGVAEPPVCTMTLENSAAVAYAEGVRVNLYPYSEEKVAHVIVTSNDDEPVACRVPVELSVQLDTGVREPGQEESCNVDVGADGEMYLVGLIGEEATVLVSSLSQLPSTVTDELPPAISPEAHVTGGVNTLFIQWSPVANLDPVTYQIHISNDSAFVAVLDDPATMAGESKGGSMFVAHTLPLDDSPLAYGTVYYVQIIAKDDDGAAAPGVQGSGTPKQVDTPDMVVGSVTADILAANSVTAEKLEAVLALLSELYVGDKISITPSDGIRITLNNGGYIHFPADGTAAELIKVIARFTQVIVEDNMQILGANNRIGGALTLDANIPPPSIGPVVTSVFDQAPLSVGSGYTGLGDAGTKWRRAKIATTAFNINNPPPNYTITVTDFDKATGATTAAWTYTSDHYATAWALTSFSHSSAYDVAVLYWNDNTTNVFDFGAGSHPHYEVVVHNNSTGTTSVYAWTGSVSGYYYPACYTDGTYIYMGAAFKSDGHLGVYRTSMTMTGLTTVLTTTAYTLRNMTGLYVGNGDYGALRYVFTFGGSLPGAASVAVHDGTNFKTGTEVWAGPTSEVNTGLAWDGSNFYTSTSANKVRKFSALKDSSPSRAVKYTWHNIAGNIESTASPVTNQVQIVRQWLLVNTDAIPTSSDTQSPDSVRIYIAAHKQPDLGAGDTSELYEIPGTSGADSPGADGFASISTFGTIVSEGLDGASNAVVDLRGSGEGRVGPWRFGKTGAEDLPAVTQITASSAAFSAQTVLASSPAIDCDGHTELEILFTCYNFTHTVATDTFITYLYDGPTAGSGTLLAESLQVLAANSGGVVCRAVVTPAAGSHTFTARSQRSAGTGTATMIAVAGVPAILTVRPTGARTP